MNRAGLAGSQLQQASSAISPWGDWLGIGASIGCAIHCAAMPFVLAYLPALGLGFLMDEAFHKWMVLVCLLIACTAFVPGIRKHGNWLPSAIGSFGLVFISFAAFGLAGECCPSCPTTPDATMATPATPESACQQCGPCDSCQPAVDPACCDSLPAVASPTEKPNLLSTLAPWITPLGGLLLVSAHLLNRRYGCLCGGCHGAAV